MKDLLSDAESFSCKILKMLGKHSTKETRDIKNQLKRAAISVPSNLAEGLGRNVGLSGVRGKVGRDYFFRIALGSLREALVQVKLFKAMLRDAAWDREFHGIEESGIDLDEELCCELGEPPYEIVKNNADERCPHCKADMTVKVYKNGSRHIFCKEHGEPLF